MTTRGARVIQAAACKFFNLQAGELLGRERYAELVVARHLAMYLCRIRLRMSFPAIGRVFQRDHSTIIDACQRVEARLESEPTLRSQLAGLRKAVDETALRNSAFREPV